MISSRLDLTSCRDSRIQDHAEPKSNETVETLKKVAIVAIAAIALMGVMAAFTTFPPVPAIGLSIAILYTAGLVILMVLGVKFEEKQHQKEIQLQNLHISPDRVAQDQQSPFDREVPQGLDSQKNN